MPSLSKSWRVRATAILVICVPVLFNIAFSGLASAFEYPGILAKEPSEILVKFNKGGSELIAWWYLIAVAGLGFIPVAIVVAQYFQAAQPSVSFASAIVGSLAGLVQGIGLFRWVFVVPYLSDKYSQTTSASTKESIELIFGAIHRFGGVLMGEHLGYTLTSSWTFMVSYMMFASKFGHWTIAVLGWIASGMILCGLLIPAKQGWAEVVNAIGYVVWSVWLIVTGIVFLFAGPEEKQTT